MSVPVSCLGLAAVNWIHVSDSAGVDWIQFCLGFLFWKRWSELDSGLLRSQHDSGVRSRLGGEVRE